MAKEQLSDKRTPDALGDLQVRRQASKEIRLLVDEGFEPGDAIDCVLRPEVKLESETQ